MDKHSIILGDHYAVRESSGDDLQHVKVVEAVRRGKWRAEWIDPNPGLTDYVKSRDIVIEWKHRRAFLRDERNARQLDDEVVRSGVPGDDHPLIQAIDWVLDSTSERSVYVHRGVLRFDGDALERLARRANIATPTHHSGYRDRHSVHHLPWLCAVELAEAFARSEPSTVLDPIEFHERELSAQMHQPGDRHIVSMLTEYRAAWAIIRQWAGHDAAVAIREARIHDLEQLLTRTMWDLRRPDPDVERVAN